MGAPNDAEGGTVAETFCGRDFGTKNVDDGLTLGSRFSRPSSRACERACEEAAGTERNGTSSRGKSDKLDRSKSERGRPCKINNKLQI